MGQQKLRDVQEILNFFEKELNCLKRLDKIEKMKVRREIANYLKPALLMKNQNPKVILYIIDDKLNDVLNLFYDKYGFLHDLTKLLSEKLKKNKCDYDTAILDSRSVLLNATIHKLLILHEIMFPKNNHATLLVGPELSYQRPTHSLQLV
jgi:hypothetical protein